MSHSNALYADPNRRVQRRPQVCAAFDSVADWFNEWFSAEYDRHANEKMALIGKQKQHCAFPYDEFVSLCEKCTGRSLGGNEKICVLLEELDKKYPREAIVISAKKEWDKIKQNMFACNQTMLSNQNSTYGSDWLHHHVLPNLTLSRWQEHALWIRVPASEKGDFVVLSRNEQLAQESERSLERLDAQKSITVYSLQEAQACIRNYAANCVEVAQKRFDVITRRLVDESLVNVLKNEVLAPSIESLEIVKRRDGVVFLWKSPDEGVVETIEQQMDKWRQTVNQAQTAFQMSQSVAQVLVALEEKLAEQLSVFGQQVESLEYFEGYKKASLLILESDLSVSVTTSVGNGCLRIRQFIEESKALSDEHKKTFAHFCVQYEALCEHPPTGSLLERAHRSAAEKIELEEKVKELHHTREETAISLDLHTASAQLGQAMQPLLERAQARSGNDWKTVCLKLIDECAKKARDRPKDTTETYLGSTVQMDNKTNKDVRDNAIAPRIEAKVILETFGKELQAIAQEIEVAARVPIPFYPFSDPPRISTIDSLERHEVSMTISLTVAAFVTQVNTRLRRTDKGSAELSTSSAEWVQLAKAALLQNAKGKNLGWHWKNVFSIMEASGLLALYE